MGYDSCKVETKESEVKQVLGSIGQLRFEHPEGCIHPKIFIDGVEQRNLITLRLDLSAAGMFVTTETALVQVGPKAVIGHNPNKEDV